MLWLKIGDDNVFWANTEVAPDDYCGEAERQRGIRVLGL